MKNSAGIIVLIILVSLTTSAIAEDWNQRLYDSIFSDKNNHYNVVVDIDGIRRALSNGADPNALITRGKYSESILSRHVRVCTSQIGPANIRAEVVKKCVEAFGILFQNKARLQAGYDDTILFWPVTGGHYDLVKLLLDKGADPKLWPYTEIGPRYKLSPIEEAARHGHNRIVDLLASRGAKRPGAVEIAQLRFVWLACFGNANNLKEQLARGAKVNEADPNGEIALLRAVSILGDDPRRNSNVMFLLGEGANVNLSGTSSELADYITTFPLHSAVHYTSYGFNSTRKRDMSYNEQLLNELIKKGANLSAIDGKGQTPLHKAAVWNNLYALRLLLSLGANTSVRDKSGKTALDYAKSPEAISLLKQFGAQGSQESER